MQDIRYFFETNPIRGRRQFRKNPARSFDVQQRQAKTLQAMIAEVDHSIMALDCSIEVECERARNRDRSHYAYPMAVRAMEARRDNLRNTRAALLERLQSYSVGAEPAAA